LVLCQLRPSPRESEIRFLRWQIGWCCSARWVLGWWDALDDLSWLLRVVLRRNPMHHFPIVRDYNGVTCV